MKGFYKKEFVQTKKVVKPIRPDMELKPEWQQDLTGALHDPPPVLRVHNARGLQEQAESRAAFFREHSFVLLNCPTQVKTWNTDPNAADNEIASIYGGEVEAALRAELFADGPPVRIKCPPYVIRRGEGVPNPYALSIHTDYGLTPDDFQANLDSYSATPELGLAWRERFERPDVLGEATLTCWRPTGMTGPVKHMPLAVLDPTTVNREDLVHFGVVGFSPAQVAPSSQLSVKYDPAQTWYYYPDMTTDEIIVFKAFEYFKGTDAPLKSCIHSAFKDPTAPEDAEKRQSCDFRVEVQYLDPEGSAA